MTGNPWVYPVIHCAGPGCAAVKKEVNRWFLISDGAKAFICRTFDLDIDGNEKPACGQQCAQKLFEQWLNRKKES